MGKKAGYISRCAEICAEKYGGDVPDNLEDALKLPGVGLKVANLLMHIAWDKASGIAVDTHVHRIANRLGWVRSSTADKTAKLLEAWVPQAYWKPLNPLLVGFGQEVCEATVPKCPKCPVSRHCPRVGVED